MLSLTSHPVREPEFSYGSKRVRLSPTQPIRAHNCSSWIIILLPYNPYNPSPLTRSHLAKRVSLFQVRSLVASAFSLAAVPLGRRNAASRSIKRSTGREPPRTRAPPPCYRTHGVPRSNVPRRHRDPGCHQVLATLTRRCNSDPTSHVSPSPIKFWLITSQITPTANYQRVPEDRPGRSVVVRRVTPLARDPRLRLANAAASPRLQAVHNSSTLLGQPFCGSRLNECGLDDGVLAVSGFGERFRLLLLRTTAPCYRALRPNPRLPRPWLAWLACPWHGNVPGGTHRGKMAITL